MLRWQIAATTEFKPKPFVFTNGVNELVNPVNFFKKRPQAKLYLVSPKDLCNKQTKKKKSKKVLINGSAIFQVFNTKRE